MSEAAVENQSPLSKKLIDIVDLALKNFGTKIQKNGNQTFICRIPYVNANGATLGEATLNRVVQKTNSLGDIKYTIVIVVSEDTYKLATDETGAAITFEAHEKPTPIEDAHIEALLNNINAALEQKIHAEEARLTREEEARVASVRSKVARII